MTTLAIPLPQPPVPIEPGDILCYSGSGLFSKLIRLKTWAPQPLGISHVEMANSRFSAFASRDGKGVQTYPIDLDPKRLVAVLCTTQPLDMGAVRAFHSQCIGQKYDVWGLFRFFTLGQQSLDKQFCSEYLTRLCRKGGVELFTPETDADLVAPWWVTVSPRAALKWKKGMAWNFVAA